MTNNLTLHIKNIFCYRCRRSANQATNRMAKVTSHCWMSKASFLYFLSLLKTKNQKKKEPLMQIATLALFVFLEVLLIIVKLH